VIEGDAMGILKRHIEVVLENGKKTRGLLLNANKALVLLWDGTTQIVPEFESCELTDLSDLSMDRIEILENTVILEGWLIEENPIYLKKLMRLWRRMYTKDTYNGYDRGWKHKASSAIQKEIGELGYNIGLAENVTIMSWSEDDDFLMSPVYAVLKKMFKPNTEIQRYIDKARLLGIYSNEMFKSKEFEELMCKAVVEAGGLVIDGIGEALYESNLEFKDERRGFEHQVISGDFYVESNESIREVIEDIRDGLTWGSRIKRQV